VPDSTAERRTTWVVAGVALVAIPLLYAVTLLDGDTVDWLISEERPVELGGFFGLAACSVLCVLIWRTTTGWARLARLALLALAVVFFFGAGEEISWGQRIFGFGTPEELARVNIQGETNVHNLAFFEGELDLDFLFQLFWLFLGVLIPLAALWAPARERLKQLVPILPAPLAAAFVLNQILTRGAAELFDRERDLYTARDFSPAHSIFEIKESIVSLLLAAGFYLLYRHVRRTRPAL